jgi:sortase A
MRVVLSHTPLRRILWWTQRVLFAGGIAMLGYCGYVLLDGWMFQNRERRHLEQLLQDRKSNSGATDPASPAGPVAVPAIAPKGLIGRIEIPRLGVSVIVMEGVDKITLRRAVGHIPSTALPGRPGNVGLAGHRDTYFRPLRNIQQGDVVTLTTLAGEYRYRVVSTKVVDPREVSVLNSDGNEILTLVTCYPFYFVGSAPSRFIVRAERSLERR